MSTLNQVTLIGRLGADVEAKAMPSGEAVANFRIATGEKWKDKKTGEMKESTEWHSIVAFGRTAEIASQYLSKGSLVCIVGQLRTRKWADKSGVDRYSTEIVSNRLTMLTGGGSVGGSRDRQPEQQSYAPQPQASAPAEPFVDDDIPF